jgi:hypothetical protein
VQYAVQPKSAFPRFAPVRRVDVEGQLRVDFTPSSRFQDAAYDSLLKSRRQALHRRAAELLREQPERAAAEPEVIAHHLTQAGLDDLAIEWWGKAGDQALRRSAFQEAIAHLGKAIAMADKSGDVNGAAVGRRASIQSKIGQALLWSKGFATEESRRAFARVEEIGGSAPNADERFAAY